MSEPRVGAELPAGWVSATVGALGKLHCGQSPSAPDVNNQGDGASYVSGPEQWDGYTVHQNKWTTKPTRTAPAGSIFITVKGAGVGTLFPGVEAAIGRDIYAFEPHPEVDDRFIFRALEYSIQDVIAKARGDIPGLTKEHILQHPIRVPGTKTQRALASKIDELFSQIDEGERGLARVQVLIERYRQSALKAAVTGELTREWREQHRGQIESGEALLKRILHARRDAWERAELEKIKTRGTEAANDKWKQKYEEPGPPDISELPELPVGWTWGAPTQLESPNSNALAIGPFGSNLRVSDYRPSGVPLVFVRNIRRQSFGDEQARFVDAEKAAELSAHTTRPGDVLITKMGDPPGDACVYPSGSSEAVITADCIKWTLHPFLPSSAYVAAFINSALGRSQFTGITTGVAQQKVSLARFRQIGIALPGPEEQLEIAARLEVELQRAEIMGRQLLDEQRRVSAARAAILRAAFSGQLVPQDPSDEPASILLERIAAERAAAAPAPKRGRKKVAKRK